jgi:hypothetical protein
MNNASAFSIKFSEDYEHFSQQMDARIASVVKNKEFTGRSYEDDYINTIVQTEITTNRATGAPTANKDLGFTRRQLTCATKTYSLFKSDKDVAEMMKDPEAEIVKEMINVMNRERDIVTIAAMKGNASEYNSGTGVYDPIALPAAQIIASAGTGLTVDKLRTAKRLMDSAEVPATGRCIAHNAIHLETLLSKTETISSDFNTVKALVNGELDTFLGFKFIHTETVGSLATDPAIAFQKDKVLFGYNLARRVRVKESEAYNFDWVLFIEEQFGALRREDVGVVEIGTE